jgi:D-alanyl-D-alanine endopeptidase (penicillin-binding protein 7)
MKYLIGIFCFLFSFATHANAVDDLIAPYEVIEIPQCCDISKQKQFDINDFIPQKHPFNLSSVRLKAMNVLVVDQQTGETLFAKNPNEIVPIASITKLMTAMVTLDANRDMGEMITITLGDMNWLKRTHSRLKPGTRLPLSEILRLALMSSDNRAAHALARTYPEGYDAFIKAMNAKAQSLEMLDTNFLDPTGLTPKNTSTAHDLVRMVGAAYGYDTIREYSTTERYLVVLSSKRHARPTRFLNSNALIHTHQWKIGLSKTGYISDAGRCVVMQAQISDRPVIIILLDSQTKKTRVKDAFALKEWLQKLLGRI